MTSEPTTWSEVQKRLRRDRERLRGLRGQNVLPLGILALHPSYQCIWLHRVSNYFFRRNHRLLARFFWHLNLLLTGADIAPISEIGPGLLLVHPISTQIFGRLGADCTIWGHTGIGGGRSNKDIGAVPAFRSSETTSLYGPTPWCWVRFTSATASRSGQDAPLCAICPPEPRWNPRKAADGRSRIRNDVRYTATTVKHRQNVLRRFRPAPPPTYLNAHITATRSMLNQAQHRCWQRHLARDVIHRPPGRDQLPWRAHRLIRRFRSLDKVSRHRRKMALAPAG
jgi:hypothetical protein